MKFAVCLANRGTFPGSLFDTARADIKKALAKQGHEALFLPAGSTRHDAVGSPKEGKIYAEFLAKNRGVIDGVILSLPNFGDENGAVVALRDAGVPILIQAYPDETDKMDINHRRDAVCGKLAMCNILRQAGIPYTLTANFAAHPSSKGFAADLKRFAALCRIVNGLKTFNVGVLGARTTPFKTVRIDEIAFQRAGVNVETIDLSVVFRMMREADEKAVADKIKVYREYSRCAKACTDDKLNSLARLGVAIDALVDEYMLDSVAVRCWDEFQKEFGISPCVVMSELNDRGFPAACECDVNNAVMMKAVQLASGEGESVAVFDVNNNYGDAKDKAVFFHCSAVPKGMLTAKGVVDNHPILGKAMGPASCVGVYNGKVKSGAITVASLRSENGKLKGFVTEGNITSDNPGAKFFGTGFVFRKDNGDMNAMLNYMAMNGYRHHVAFAYGSNADVVIEALVKYLGYEIDRI
jgi:L-fucose isomerase-like protein